MYFYQPSQGHGLPHGPLNAVIGPRPTGWIVSRDGNGRHDLALYSFFNCFNYHPPIIGFANSGRKDSVQNIVETGEFAWNLTTLELAVTMNETSASLSHGEGEFFAAGLSKADSRIVNTPHVAQSPVNFECCLSQTLQLTIADGASVETWLVLGEVVGIHIDETLLGDGIYQTAKVKPVLRAGGPTMYYSISETHRFDLVRPDARVKR